eukprot:3921600-Amphidinium_carterae.1
MKVSDDLEVKCFGFNMICFANSGTNHSEQGLLSQLPYGLEGDADHLSCADSPLVTHTCGSRTYSMPLLADAHIGNKTQRLSLLGSHMFLSRGIQINLNQNPAGTRKDSDNLQSYQ